MNKTAIEYLTHTWNPIAMRCTPAGEGCAHCWHLRMADRLAGNDAFPTEVRAAYAGDGPPVLVKKRLGEPMRRKIPSIVGVQFMGDLFHEKIAFEDIDYIFDAMRIASQHTFMVLTKRPQRAIQYLEHDTERKGIRLWWPPHIWFGVSAENQKWANERIPLLLQTPATTKFVSVEPCLSPIDLCNISIDSWTRYNALGGCGVTSRGVVGQSYPNVHGNKLDWVVVGTETGPGARSMHLNWARRVRDQCVEFGTPFFYKRGETGRLLDGRLWEQYPISMVQRE